MWTSTVGVNDPERIRLQIEEFLAEYRHVENDVAESEVSSATCHIRHATWGHEYTKLPTSPEHGWMGTQPECQLRPWRPLTCQCSRRRFHFLR
jgi:hypothetical protein